MVETNGNGRSNGTQRRANGSNASSTGNASRNGGGVGGNRTVGAEPPVVGVDGMPSLSGLFENLSTQFERVREQFQDMRQDIKNSYTATSDKRALSVTVGARGELTGIKFNTDGYKRMAPAELAAMIVSTAEKARAQALSAVREKVQPGLPPGVSFDDLVSGEIDLDKLLPKQMFDPSELSAFLNRLGRAGSGGATTERRSS